MLAQAPEMTREWNVLVFGANPLFVYDGGIRNLSKTSIQTFVDNMLWVGSLASMSDRDATVRFQFVCTASMAAKAKASAIGL